MLMFVKVKPFKHLYRNFMIVLYGPCNHISFIFVLSPVITMTYLDV